MVSRVEGTMLRTALPGDWASKQGQGATRSSSPVVRRVEQLNNGILEFLFPHGDADMNRCNLPLPVDQQRGWERVQSAVRGTDVVVAEEHPIVHLHLLHIGFDGRR